MLRKIPLRHYEYKTVTVRLNFLEMFGNLFNFLQKMEEKTDKIINDMSKERWELYQQNKPSFGPHTLTFRRRAKIL